MTPTDEQEHQDDIVVECELDAPPEKVWRALTVPELAAEWLGAPGDGAASPYYEVLDAQPFSRVRYAWRDDLSDDSGTVVTIELSPQTEGRTLFRLTHSASTAPRVMPANSNGVPIARAA